MFMNKNSVRVLLTGGGSGGPTFAANCFSKRNHQKRKDSIFLFLGSKKGPERQMVEQAGITFENIPSGKLRRYFSWRNFLIQFLSLEEHKWIYKIVDFRPHVIVSAGSFVSVPVAYMSWFLRIPHVILQMDVRPGLANRLMAPVSHALSYLL